MLNTYPILRDVELYSTIPLVSLTLSECFFCGISSIHSLISDSFFFKIRPCDNFVVFQSKSRWSIIILSSTEYEGIVFGRLGEMFLRIDKE
jgi:hypothetical protein